MSRGAPGALLAGVILALALAIAMAMATPALADRALARARVEEGHALVERGDRGAALARFEEAIAQDPDYLPAFDAATELWIAAGELDRLIERLSRATLRHPDYAAGWYALAFAYRERGRADLAVACYESYIAYRGEDPDPHYGLALAALEVGQERRAVQALQRYLELERRAERAEFVARARAELARLGLEPAPAPVLRIAPVPDRPLGDVDRLLAEGRAGSAAALLGAEQPGTPEARAEWWRQRAEALHQTGDLGGAGRAAALALAEAAPDRAVYITLGALARAAADAVVAAYFDGLAASY